MGDRRELQRLRRRNQQLEEENNLLRLKVDILLDMVSLCPAPAWPQHEPRVLGPLKEAAVTAPRFLLYPTVQHRYNGKVTVGVKPDPLCEKRGKVPPTSELVVNAVTEEREAPASAVSPLSLSAQNMALFLPLCPLP